MRSFKSTYLSLPEVYSTTAASRGQEASHESHRESKIPKHTLAKKGHGCGCSLPSPASPPIALGSSAIKLVGSPRPGLGCVSEELVCSLTTRMTCVGFFLHETSQLCGDSSACGLSACLDICKCSSSAVSRWIIFSAGAVDALPFAKLSIPINLSRSQILQSITAPKQGWPPWAPCEVHMEIVHRVGAATAPWGIHGLARAAGISVPSSKSLPALPSCWKIKIPPSFCHHRDVLVNFPPAPVEEPALCCRCTHCGITAVQPCICSAHLLVRRTCSCYICLNRVGGIYRGNS